MSEPIVIPAGGGEIVGDSPERRVEILADHDSLHATWSRFGPGREGADLHVHHRHTDLFYVLDGELTVRLGPEGREVAVPAGSLARVPPLVVHGFRNGSDAEVRYLNLHAPGQGFADFLRGLRDGRPVAYDQHDPPADDGSPVAEAVFGAGEPLVDRPELRVVLRADVEEIAIAELWADPGAPPLDAHPGPGQIESLYVLAGEIALAAGERELRAPQGSWVQVPSGGASTVSFPGPEPVRLLAISTPIGGLADYLRALA